MGEGDGVDDMDEKLISPTFTSSISPALSTSPGLWATVRHQASRQGRQLEVGNLATLGLGEAICRVATLVAFVHLARTLTPGGYGQVELTLAILLILTLVVDQGLGTFGTREVAREPRLARPYTRHIILLQLAAAVVVVGGTVLVCLVSQLDRTLKLLLIGYSVSLLGFPFHLQWLFQGLRQMRRVAAPQVLRWGLFTALVFVLVRQPNDILIIPFSEIVAVAAGAALFLLFLWKLKARRPGGRGQPSVARQLSVAGLMKESLPIGGSNLLWAMRMYLPTVLVGVMATQAVVGYFGTAHRVLMAFQTFVNVYFMNFLPLVADKMHRSPGQVVGLIRRSVILTGTVGLLAAIVVTVSSPFLVGLVFGEVYARSQSPVLLSIVVWVIPAFVLRHHARSILIAMGRQRVELTCSLAGLVGLISAGTALTARYGAAGTAWTMIGSEILAASLSWVAVKYYWSDRPRYPDETPGPLS
ncbi:MAG: oligosaccharide flippase family protein [Acidobacteriota bacterium]